MNKLACIFAILSLGTACSASNGGGLAPDASTSDAASTSDTPSGSGDATAPPADAATPPADAAASADRATPPADRATPPADRVTPPADAAPVGDYGTCGMGLRDAICMCGMNATCQQMALQRALTTDMDCATCYATAIAGCCPMESSAIQTCARNAGCTDQACAQRMCASQFMALQTCAQRGQMSVPSCQMRFGTCFGSTFPMLTCGG